jgi:flagellar secretion chaperone FliS
MFSPASTRAASVYKRVEVETSVTGADPHQLIELLFQSLQTSLMTARVALSHGDVAGKCVAISRCVRLLEEGLKPGLSSDQGNALAGQLRQLYDYAIVRLSLANLKNDARLVAEVEGLIAPVADAWRQLRK